MEQFVDKLIAESDQWITKSALKDKSIFQTALEEIISHHSQISDEIVDLLWTKLQQKYAQSSNSKPPHFFSEVDIDQFLNAQPNTTDKHNALLSHNASLKHLDSHSKLNPFFKSYNQISYPYMSQLFDILLQNKQCNDAWLSLAQHRFNQLLSNPSQSTKLSNKNVRILSQKLYRLFCHTLALKCSDKHFKPNICVLFSQILLLCKDYKYCTDISMNIVSLTRILLEYYNSHKSVQTCIDLKPLITKLLCTAMQRYSRMHKWSNTQQLIYLWTVYECHTLNIVAHKQMRQILQWSETKWDFNELKPIFDSDKCMESFADFTDCIYKYNMLSMIDNSDNNGIEDGTAEFMEGSDDSDEEEDVMDMGNDTVIINNINDIKDEDLFVIDIESDKHETSGAKRVRDYHYSSSEEDEMVGSEWGMPSVKKQKN